ncbi:MAG: winged helix-turn-helix domain-containing protein [Emticicia sp.]|nr:winged helix-turn-helix domain-containing protein [Emticicia sp.]
MQRLEIQNKLEIQGLIKDYFKNNDEARFVHRLHGILLVLENDDTTCDSIGNMFGNSPRTISNWIKKVNTTGTLESLRDDKKPGRTSRLNSLQLEELKKVLQKNPEESGVASNIWDGKSLSWYIETNYQITLKVRRCQELFHELGFSLKRARPIVSKGSALKKEESKKNSQKR